MEVKAVSLGRKIQGVDDETAVALFHGLNVTQLSKLFEMDKRDVTYKIEQAGIRPTGMHRGIPTYRVKEVAPALVKPIYNIETYLRKMHPNDLPKELSKEFWAGLRSKQEYLLRAGDLWPTAKVVEQVGELFKIVKMAALLCTDTVERQVELSERQRSIIKQSMDGMLNDLHQTIVEKFSAKESSDEQQQPAADSEEL